MAKSKGRHKTEEIKMDMTPMIDCVFQLIIFFFLIIDLQNQELELLKLPKARFAVPDQPPEGVRPILNVKQNGDVIYRKRKIYDHTKETDFAALKEQLEYFADNLMKKEYDKTLKKQLPDDPLLIRADKWTEMHFVAKIMQTCGDKDVLIWKVELAVGEPEERVRARMRK